MAKSMVKILGMSDKVSSTGLEVIKLFSCSSQLKLKFILLINVKMPTTVGILTFISRINYWLGCSKLKFLIIWTISIIMSSLNFMLSRVEHENIYYNLSSLIQIGWYTHTACKTNCQFQP